ncbi:MAG: YoaK family protein [Bacillota bacterium]
METSRSNPIQLSQSLIVGITLALVGGFLDAYTYILKGGVFANAQTGNIVLLGINLAEANFTMALTFVFPILAFVLGVIIVEIIKKKYRFNNNIHWRQIIIAFEILVLVGIGFITDSKHDIIVNVAISFVCSMQVQSFRLLNGNTFATTMCTGNLRSAAEQLFRYSITHDKTARNSALNYLVIIVFFIIGALCGTIASLQIGAASIWICCGALVLVFFTMFIRK